jgi:hypothetical protein
VHHKGSGCIFVVCHVILSCLSPNGTATVMKIVMLVESAFET